MISSNTILEDISQVIGYSATNRLVDWFGGTDLYVPDAPSRNHLIANIVGYSAMVALCNTYRQSTLAIPFDNQRDISRRNRMIGLMIERGISESEISRVSLLSRAMLRKIRLQLERDGVLPLILGKRGK
jgi:hypothetical protein